MMKYLALMLIALLRVDIVSGIDVGKWTSLGGESLRTAAECYCSVNEANKWLGIEDVKTRNTLVVSLKSGEQFLTLFSGMLPLKPARRTLQNSFYTFLDVLIGKENAEIFSTITNEAKDICLSFAKLSGKLTGEKTALASQFREVVSIIKISNTSPLSEIMKLKDSIKFEKDDEGSDLYKFVDKLKKHNKFVSEHTGNYLLDYLTALERYFLFISEFLPEAKAALSQLKAIESRADLLSNENVIDVLSDSSLVSSVIPFLHTETLLAYIMFSRQTNFVDQEIIDTLLDVYGKNSLVMTTFRDMCALCEKTWARRTMSDSKCVTVFSFKEHENSWVRHSDEVAFLRKIPLSSDINSSWNTINRGSSQDNWSSLLRYVFSPRMLALINDDYISRLIRKSEIELNKGFVFAKVPMLFDHLVNSASTVNMAADIYRHRSRTYFMGTAYKPTLNLESELAATYADKRLRSVGSIFLPNITYTAMPYEGEFIGE